MIICFLVSEIITWCQHCVDKGGQGENGGSDLFGSKNYDWNKYESDC